MNFMREVGGAFLTPGGWLWGRGRGWVLFERGSIKNLGRRNPTLL